MRLVLLTLAILISGSLQAQKSNFWSSINENSILLNADNDRGTIPVAYQTFALELEEMKAYLRDAPMHRTPEALSNPLTLELPLPNGDIHPFNIVNTPVMKPGLAARYPQIQSFTGYSTIDRGISVKFLYSTHGFRAFLKTPQARYYIQPYANGIQDAYIVFDKKDEPIPTDINLTCGVSNSDEYQYDSPIGGLQIDPDFEGGATIRNTTTTTDVVVEMVEYEIAIAGVAEWVNNQGGTVADGMSSVAIVVTLLNQVMGAEAAFNFVLVENNDLLMYLDPVLDPYNDITDGGGLLQQNQTNLNMTLGSANYDIGHVMTLSCVGVGGIAALGSTCSTGSKGRGVTCNGGNLENAILNIAVHEVAHQFSATHTWNNCIGEIGNPPQDIITARSSGTAYEPGSGSTILSYAGGCQEENIVFNGDEYYHVASLDQMFAHSHFGGSSECPDYIPSNNNRPDLTIGYQDGFYIPIGTPFELKADATDLDDDVLTYCWEQYNLGPIYPLGSPFGNGPTFRSFPPTADPMRTFPRIQNILGNSFSDVEVLPTYSRDFTFRCTVRDNNPEIGGVVWDEVSFEATESAGPFKINYPSSNEILQVGDYIEVLWDVANTDGNLVNCQKVDILLSDNGGFAFPHVLAENVPNDGSHFVTVPEIITGGARIKVIAADNIFFDISNFNSIIEAADSAGYAFSAGPFNQQVCAPDDVVFNLNTISLLDYDSPVTFSVEGLPTGAVANFSSNPVVPSEDLTLNIDITSVTDEGFYDIEVIGIAAGGDTLVRPLTFDIVLNDFSALAPVGPANGSSGVTELPTFTWDPSPNAVSYDIEIASSPSFAPGTIIESATGIIGSSFEPASVLEKNNLFFWRVRASNECGPGAFSVPQGFHTELFECATFGTEIAVNISGVGTPTIESPLVINSQGTVNDLNVINLKGAHDLVQHLDVSLIGPDNTEVLLFSEICGVATVFNLGLNDEAPDDIQCPPTTGQFFKPQGSLSDFNNLPASGTWILKIVVNDNDGTGGLLERWGLELCSSASTSAPYLVTNELMPLPPGAARQITSDFLLSEDDNNTPGQLTYTVVTAPEHGTVLFQDNPVEVGMTFRQSSLNAGNVKYEHDGGSEVTDGFTFAVTDGEGGWFGTPRFEIEIDPNIVLDVEELEKFYNFSVFPNPTQDVLNLEFNRPINDKVEVSITNVQGQVIQTQIFDNITQIESINTARLTNGVYFIYVKSENAAVATERFVIQK